MATLGIEMTDKEEIRGRESLAPRRTDFPPTPEDVRAIRTPEMARIAKEIQSLERQAWEAFQAGKPDDYWLYSEADGILFEHLKVMACKEFVSQNTQTKEK